ncbi:hypothetical protein AB0F17_22885 [Nonomuraea sp. NPDC026600]|uniref:hypothetical protein n=1 Tax=Nonomuraea sp. NPDC026600 TaxID=3155363 RepID=UPI0033E0B18F
MLARTHSWDKLAVSGYLVDAYCLGAKNATGPDIQTEMELRRFRAHYFSAYPQGWQDAPLDLAQHLVFGGAAYAHSLGFEPHQDFAACSAQLDTWSGPAAITFGKDGRPLYISGPYDSPSLVTTTLNRSVGKGNYDFVLGAPELDTFDRRG